MFRKYLSALLALAIILCGMPGAALAEGEEQIVSEVVQAVEEAAAEAQPGPAAPEEPAAEPAAQPEAELPEGPTAEPAAEPAEGPAPEAAPAEAADDRVPEEAQAPAPEASAEPAVPEETDSPGEAPLPGETEALALPEAEADGEAPMPNDAEVETGEVPASVTDAEEAAGDPAPATLESISVKGLTLGVGQVEKLSVQALPEGLEPAYAFATSAKKIVAVSADGRVKGMKAGTATITVTADGQKATCKVTVKAAPKSIKLSNKSGTLGVGESYRLTYTLPKNTAASVAFASDKPGVAAVDPATGLVTAVSPGTAVVTAKTHNGKKAACKVTVKAAPEAIELNAAEITVGQGLTVAVKGTVNAGAAGAVGYSSSDESVFTVDARGKLRGVGLGTAELTASTYVEGVTATATVTVLPVPDKVTVQKSLTLGVKDKFQLTPEVPEGTYAGFAYKSSNAKVAAVSADGVVTGRKAGKATITVATANGKKATCKVTVKAAPKSISLSSKSGTLGVGESYRLTYTLPKNTAASVKFASDNESVATVDAATGLVTAINPGSAVVTAKTHNGKKAACKVTVLAAPEAIELNAAEFTVGKGLTATVKGTVNAGAAGAVRYSSSDESVFTVDAKGKLRGVGLGTAELTASTYVEGVTARATVTVLPVPGKVTVQKSLTLGVQDSFRLTPVIPEGTYAGFAYKSSNKKVAAVSADGVVTGRKAGTATITVATANGKKATCKVTVKAAPKSLGLSQSSALLGVGESCRLTYTLPKNTAGSVTFASDDDTVASVDAATGLVTAVRPGSAVITARTHNGKTAACKVTVLNAPDSVTIAGPAELELGVGQTLQLDPALPAGTSSAIAWTSSDPGAASVSAGGLVKGVAPGETTVTASTYIPGVEASVHITVWGAPGKVTLPETAVRLPLSDCYQIVPVLPAGTRSELKYASSRASVASVSPEGLVVAQSEGTAKITVSTYNGKTAALTVEVYDPYKPESIVAGDLPDLLTRGEELRIECSVLPASASQDILWTSTEPDIASVDAAGTVRALSPGMATVVGVAARNSAVRLEYTFVVLSDDVCLVIPERRTGVDGIDANLKRIRAIEDCVYDELDLAYKGGVISKAEYTRRTSAIKNAFAMYAFPWMTDSKMLYWKSANSEGGAKDFKPGIVYYGLPYTQTHREFNVSKAVNGGYYTKASGKKYYVMDTSKVSARHYKGNDCSSFVSMAYWGTSSSNSYLNTTSIASSGAYKTIPWTERLVAGDLICKGGSHVLMFLYYADVAHTQIMIIEQGGGEAAINTCSCSIRKVADYQNKKYVIRRLVQY